MKRSIAMSVLVLALLAVPGPAAWAQEAPPPASPAAAGEAGEEPAGPVARIDLFAWYPRWDLGWLYAGLGAVGALIILFGLIGGAVPGTAGQAKIDADSQRLERLSQRLEELISRPQLDADTIKAVESAVNNLRDDLRAERWRQFALAAVFYLVLGAFFAALLAEDILQAVILGASWTGLVGSLGLKRDYAERKAVKDEALDKAMKVIESRKPTAAFDVTGRRGETRAFSFDVQPEIAEAADPGEWKALQEEMRTARGL